MAQIQDFDFKQKRKTKNAEKIVLGALAVFFTGLVFFAYVSFDALGGKKSARLMLNISKKITEPEEVLSPQISDVPQSPEKKSEPKTEMTDDLLAMLAEQKDAPPAAKTEPVETASGGDAEKKPIEKKENKHEDLFTEKKEADKKRTPAQIVLEDRLPPPDLISGSLLQSLPNFGSIKASAPSVAPLPVIRPLPVLRDENGLPAPFVQKNETQTPFEAYKRPVSSDLPEKIPFVAVLLSGVGMRDNATSSAVNALSADVSLSYSPYATHLEKAVADARQAGHETFLDFPMQFGVFPAADPGPVGVVAGLPERENKRRLKEILSKNVAFIGLTGTVDETFSKTSPQMPSFVEELRQRRLIYINSSDDFKETAANVLTADVVIYKDFYRSAIKARLEKARRIALSRGYAFVHARAVPVVMLTIKDWMESFERRGDNADLLPELVFVPVSYLAEKTLSNGN